MPTVSPDIKPAATLPRFRGKSEAEKLSFFPAEQWADKGGEAGEWRVMRGTAWLNRPGESHSFFDLEGIALLIMGETCRGLGEDFPKPNYPARPRLPRGVRVRVYRRMNFDLVSFTTSEPFQNAFGEWCVNVLGEPQAVLFRDVEVVRGRKKLRKSPRVEGENKVAI
jgi:hypothetical protein